MQMIPVSSSNLDSVGYDSLTGKLYIRFNSGGLYEYDKVPYSVYEGLMHAASHGRYFHAHIKGIYAYRRIG